MNVSNAWLRPQSFEIALRLAVQAKEDGIGWVVKTEFSVDKYHQAFLRLRQDLGCTGIDPSTLVENNAFKQYRLNVVPENISWDEERIRANAGELLRVLKHENRT